MKHVKNEKVEIEKRAETIINPLTLTEDQQPYFNCPLKSVGSSFAIAFVTITAYNYFADFDIDPLVRKKIVEQFRVKIDDMTLKTFYLLMHSLSMVVLIHMNLANF